MYNHVANVKRDLVNYSICVSQNLEVILCTVLLISYNSGKSMSIV